MEYVVLLYNGLKVIFLVDNNLCNISVTTLHHCIIITCGVRQGSILGPLLFFVSINDLCSVSKVLELILFADDTNIFYSHTDASYLMEIVNLELENK